MTQATINRLNNRRSKVWSLEKEIKSLKREKKELEDSIDELTKGCDHKFPDGENAYENMAGGLLMECRICGDVG